MLRGFQLLVLSAFPLVASVSCGSQSQNDSACTPGQSIQCAGENGCLGAQVCNADGTAYDSCICGNPGSRGTGGSQLNSMSSAGTMHSGGAGSSLSSQTSGGSGGGRTSTGVGLSTGGTTSTYLGSTGPYSTGGSPTCEPANMTGTNYPPYIPALYSPGACTEQAISQYYAEGCYQKDCAEFSLSGSYALCGGCLSPSILTAGNYGPVLKIGDGDQYFWQLNVPGCEQILGERSCAAKMQLEFFCEYWACASNCASADATSFVPLFTCMNQAVSGTCASQHAAAQCLTSSANAAACTGSSFQEQFIAVAKVFCL